MRRVGEIAYPRKEHTNWLSKIKWSAWKTYNIMQTEKFIFRNIYKTTINENAMNLKEIKERCMGVFGKRKMI